MACQNKNNLLDLFFQEGDEHIRRKTQEHVANCSNCQKYLTSLKNILDSLDTLEVEEPSEKIFNNIIKEISASGQKAMEPKNSRLIIPILEIALGQIFLFIIIFLIKIKIDSMPVWKTISEFWTLQALGSTVAAIILILTGGTFLTLTLAPILMYKSKKM